MRKAWLGFVWMLCTPLVWAQIQITAQVDKTEISLDDEVTLSLHVQGGTNIRPQLPSLPAFNVYSRVSNSYSINGKTSYEFRYILVPRLVGNATIGPIRIDYNGQTYQTDPINIRIYRDATSNSSPTPAVVGTTVATDSAAATNTATDIPPADDPLSPPFGMEHINGTGNLTPREALTLSTSRELTQQAYKRGQSEPFFLVSAVSNARPYVGQSFTLAVRFYYSQAFDNAPYHAPEVSNLFMEDAGSSEGHQTIGDRVFYYREMRYQLVGAAPGKGTISSASIEFTASPFNWFDRLFGITPVSATPRVFESAPIYVQIRPLPTEGRPASFYGAVGAGYTLSAAADPKEVEAGESVNLSVTVTHSGNLKTVKDLVFPELPGFKSYPVAPASGTGKRNYKTFKTVLVPSFPGVYTIPAIEWTYFDPTLGQYKTLQTQPIPLQVNPSSVANRSVDFSTSLPSNNGLQTLGSDITYLKTIPAPQENFLVRLSRFEYINWAALGLVGLTLLFCLLGRNRSASTRAYGEAKRSLQKATSYEQISEAISLYLAHKLNIHTGSTPLKEVVSFLQKRGYPNDTLRSFATLWQQLEALRFAPAAAGTSVKQQAAKALSVLKLLEEKPR